MTGRGSGRRNPHEDSPLLAPLKVEMSSYSFQGMLLIYVEIKRGLELAQPWSSKDSHDTAAEDEAPGTQLQEQSPVGGVVESF